MVQFILNILQSNLRQLEPHRKLTATNHNKILIKPAPSHRISEVVDGSKKLIEKISSIKTNQNFI